MKAHVQAKIAAMRMLILCILLCYLSFMVIDLRQRNLGNTVSIYIKYCSILLCFTLSLFIEKDYIDKTDRKLLHTALFFTILADFCLIILDEFFLGVCFFCLVQSTYILRHSRNLKEKVLPTPMKALIILLSAVVIGALSYRFTHSLLYAAAVPYSMLLLTSVYTAVRTPGTGFYPSVNARVIVTAIPLFFLCDLNVGLFNILQESSMSFTIGFLMWFFYLPSQLLLSLSGYSPQTLRRLLHSLYYI